MDLVLALAARDARRPGARERPGRRSARGGGAGPVGHAATACSPGNEIGVLLADDALEHADTGGRPKLVVTTVVSSSLLSRMAHDRGAQYRETLTGFKWIADTAIRAERDGIAFVMGYEEALGYSVGTAGARQGRDRGRAAARRADAAPEVARRRRCSTGSTSSSSTHGLSHQIQWSATLPGPEGRKRIDAAMAALRKSPPQTIGESPVVRALDAASGEVRRCAASVARAACPRPTCSRSSPKTARGSPCGRAAPSPRSSSTWSWSGARRSREEVASRARAARRRGPARSRRR